MEDKVLLKILFNNNLLRTNLQGYESYVCDTNIAYNLINTLNNYYSDKSKSLQITKDDIDSLFTTEFSKSSEEYQMWEEVKNLNISDIDIIEKSAIKHIKTQIKDYFLAEAFSDDVYDRAKLEELYDVLSKLSNLDALDNSVVEDVELSNIEECVDIYSSRNREGIKFFDERVSNTLSSGFFDYGTINILTAPPGNGKTMLALNQAVYVASTGKHTLHLAIGDLTRKQVIIRLLAIITDKPMKQILLLNKEQFRKFIEVAKNKYSTIFEHLHCKTILPNTKNGLELIKIIKSTQDDLNIHFDQVTIDYDGNVETAVSSTKKKDKTSSMYYEGADLYNNFAAFAKNNETVVWILSQPKIQYWGDEKIPLEGLNDSSKKQHIADFIMSLGKKIPDEPRITLFISKNRHGISNVTLYSDMDGATQKIKSIDDWS